MRAVLITVLDHCGCGVGFDSLAGLLTRPEHSETNAMTETETKNYETETSQFNSVVCESKTNRYDRQTTDRYDRNYIPKSVFEATLI